MVERSTQQEDIAILYVYAPKTEQQNMIGLKEEINKSTSVVGDFNIPF